MNVEDENEVRREQRIALLRDRARVFRELFTLPIGKTVLETLEALFGHGIPMNELDDNGRTDALRTWRKMGACDVINYIHTQIAEKEPSHVDRSGKRT